MLLSPAKELSPVWSWFLALRTLPTGNVISVVLCSCPVHLCLCSLWGPFIQRTSLLESESIGSLPGAVSSIELSFKPGCLQSSGYRGTTDCVQQLLHWLVVSCGFLSGFAYWGSTDCIPDHSLIVACFFWFQIFIFPSEVQIPWDQWVTL